MRFIDESRQLFYEFRDEIFEFIPELESTAAFGAVGSGSEFYGFDDEISHDHDFCRGFCIFINEEDDIRFGVRLSRLYRKLVPDKADTVSSGYVSKLGVIKTSDFYMRHIGSPGAPETWQQWLYLPSYALAEATNGEIFEDNLWEFSSIRNEIKCGMPEDVRKKKIAARCALAAQSGQYNYSRCLKHGQNGAAYLALGEFVKNASELVFLLNKAHAPYYKWIFKAMEGLDKLSVLSGELQNLYEYETAVKAQKIEEISSVIISELKNQGLSSSESDFLEDHAYNVQKIIENKEIRAMHIMEG